MREHIARDPFYNHCIPWTPYNHCLPWNPQKIQEDVYKAFTHGNDMHNTTHTGHTTQEWEASKKTCIISIMLSKPIKPI